MSTIVLPHIFLVIRDGIKSHSSQSISPYHHKRDDTTPTAYSVGNFDAHSIRYGPCSFELPYFPMYNAFVRYTSLSHGILVTFLINVTKTPCSLRKEGRVHSGS